MVQYKPKQAVIKKLPTKKFLRKKILNLLRNQKEEQRLSKSRIIQKKVTATKEFKQAKIILFYASFMGEVDTWNMMRQALRLGKKVFLPRVLKDQKKMMFCLIENLENDLFPGTYGIMEPCEGCVSLSDPAQIDLVIVPGVAFDKNNHRLGRGGGFYDRFLNELSSSIPTFGLAFDFQIVKHLPYNRMLDVQVSRVVSN